MRILTNGKNYDRFNVNRNHTSKRGNQLEILTRTLKIAELDTTEITDRSTVNHSGGDKISLFLITLNPANSLSFPQIITDYLKDY